jgi:uncharacterized membrane protein
MSITINRSVEDVFAVLSNIENDPKYSSLVVEATKTSAGPTGVGATARLVSKFMGRRIENEWVMTEFEPNRQYGWRSTSGPVPLGGLLTFEPATGGTRVAGTVEAEPRGLFRLIGPLIVSMGRRQLQHDLANCKRLMEANAL